MYSLETRLEAFRQIPFGAQLALITSTRINPILGKNQEYIEYSERIHAECLIKATPEQHAAYEQANIASILPNRVTKNIKSASPYLF